MKETPMATTIAEFAVKAHDERRQSEERVRAEREAERAEREEARKASAWLEAGSALRDQLGLPADLIDQVRLVRHHETHGLLEWVLVEFDVADLHSPMQLVVKWNRASADDPGPNVHGVAGHWAGLGRPAYGHRLRGPADLGERIEDALREQHRREQEMPA